MTMTKYNETYGTTHRKYTINIPNELFKLAEDKSKEAGYAELAPYLRHVISREVTSGELNIQDILGIKEAKRQEYVVKQRREIVSNTKYSFVKIKIKKVLDLFNPRQYTLF